MTMQRALPPLLALALTAALALAPVPAVAGKFRGHSHGFRHGRPFAGHAFRTPRPFVGHRPHPRLPNLHVPQPFPHRGFDPGFKGPGVVLRPRHHPVWVAPGWTWNGSQWVWVPGAWVH